MNEVRVSGPFSERTRKKDWIKALIGPTWDKRIKLEEKNGMWYFGAFLLTDEEFLLYKLTFRS